MMMKKKMMRMKMMKKEEEKGVKEEEKERSCVWIKRMRIRWARALANPVEMMRPEWQSRLSTNRMLMKKMMTRMMTMKKKKLELERTRKKMR